MECDAPVRRPVQQIFDLVPDPVEQRRKRRPRIAGPGKEAHQVVGLPDQFRFIAGVIRPQELPDPAQAAADLLRVRKAKLPNRVQPESRRVRLDQRAADLQHLFHIRLGGEGLLHVERIHRNHHRLPRAQNVILPFNHIVNPPRQHDGKQQIGNAMHPHPGGRNPRHLLLAEGVNRRLLFLLKIPVITLEGEHAVNVRPPHLHLHCSCGNSTYICMAISATGKEEISENKVDSTKILFIMMYVFRADSVCRNAFETCFPRSLPV